MKALLSKGCGDTDTLVIEMVSDPVPGEGEVLVAVKACGINYPDVLIIKDQYQFKPKRPFSPGGEISGIVEKVGKGVVGVAVGQRVLALMTYGGLAEKVVVASDRVVGIPKEMPFDVAAALLMTYETSYYALTQKGALQEGETLFVLGAGGGVGLAAVELGCALGARVVAAASSREKLNEAKSKGASLGVIYPAEPKTVEDKKKITSLFKEVLGSKGWDVACDSVGGAYSEAAMRAGGWGGRFLVVGFPAGIPSFPLNLTLLKSTSIIGVFLGAAIERKPELHSEMVDALMKLYIDGKIQPHISERFKLENAGDAIERLAKRKAIGKVVVMMSCL